MPHTNMQIAGLRNAAEDLNKLADALRDDERTKREMAMLRMLEELEWSVRDHGYDDCCPKCRHTREMGHSGDCRFRNVLEGRVAGRCASGAEKETNGALSCGGQASPE